MSEIWVHFHRFNLFNPDDSIWKVIDEIGALTSEEFADEVRSAIDYPFYEYEVLQVEFDSGYVDVIFLAEDGQYKLSYTPDEATS